MMTETLLGAVVGQRGARHTDVGAVVLAEQEETRKALQACGLEQFDSRETYIFGPTVKPTTQELWRGKVATVSEAILGLDSSMGSRLEYIAANQD
jgi:hypothetical protein